MLALFFAKLPSFLASKSSNMGVFTQFYHVYPGLNLVIKMVLHISIRSEKRGDMETAIYETIKWQIDS